MTDTNQNRELAHRSDPISSHLAAARLNPSDRARVKRAVLQLLAEEPRPTFKLTTAYFNLRVANGWPSVKPDGIAKRLSELHKAGQVEETGELVRSPYDRDVVVWRVAEERPS
jgi:hypothetical protein